MKASFSRRIQQERFNVSDDPGFVSIARLAIWFRAKLIFFGLLIPLQCLGEPSPLPERKSVLQPICIDISQAGSEWRRVPQFLEEYGPDWINDFIKFAPPVSDDGKPM